MKIKSLLLGSVVAMGLSTGAAFAADPLGVLTSLDVCDSLGISGLTISSDTNCLAISGSIEFEYAVLFSSDDDTADEESDLSWSLTFDAANSTEFGPAHAILTMTNGDDNGGAAVNGDGDVYTNVFVDEAYVSIGDQTVLAAGLKDGIADDFTTTGYVTTNRTFFNGELSELNDSNDSSFRRHETSAIGDNSDDGYPSVGQLGISVVHQFGDGFSAGVALEDIEPGASYVSDTALVGFVAVEQEMWSGYLAASLDEVFNDQDAFDVAAGIAGEFDAFSFKAAGYYASQDGGDAILEALISAQAELDIVTLAAELWYADSDADTADEGGELSATASASFGVTESAEIAFAIRYEAEENGAGTGDDTDAFGAEAQVVADISDTLSATVQGYWWNTDAMGVEGSLTWNPDGDDNFEATLYAGFNNEYEDGVAYVGTSIEKAFE